MLKQRIITAVLMVAIFLGAVFLLPTPCFSVLLGVALLVAGWEWTRLNGFSMSTQIAFYVSVTASLAFSYFFSSIVAAWLLWVSLLWWAGIMVSLIKYKPDSNPVSSTDPWVIKCSQFLMGLIVLVPAWWALVNLHSEQYGISWFLYVFLLVWCADTGAYFAGKRFGKHKLALHVSPGKTIEGALGGLVLVLCLSLAGLWWLDIESQHQVVFVVLSLIVAVFSVVGDLFESIIKRKAGVKDSSQLLPGHGGVLDRIDSILAAAPLFLLGLIVFNIT